MIDVRHSHENSEKLVDVQRLFFQYLVKSLTERLGRLSSTAIVSIPGS